MKKGRRRELPGPQPISTEIDLKLLNLIGEEGGGKKKKGEEGEKKADRSRSARDPLVLLSKGGSPASLAFHDEKKKGGRGRKVLGIIHSGDITQMNQSFFVWENGSDSLH